jgi:hypothetical protein
MVGVVLSAAVVVYVFRLRAPRRPRSLVMSICQAVAPGMRRFKGDFGTQFDVPEVKFSVKDWARDMPPGTLYAVTLKETVESMVVWHDDDVFNELKNAFPVFSRHVGEDDVRTRDGRIIGRDRWGNLSDGERWRYVTFFDGDAVGYRPMSPDEARLFDQVINSACLSLSP